MKIGFVSTWFERGGAYVTKAYINLLKNDHDIYIYARGGEQTGKNDSNWNQSNVTWAPRLFRTNINFTHIKKWIMSNELDMIFFNEQQEIQTIYKIKKKFPSLKIGSYIDYYKQDTVSDFYIYDFLICNTKRHYFVFKDHPQCYYIPWGTDTELFIPGEKIDKNQFVFFHSAGMSNRKGTTFVIDSFIGGGIYKNSKLIIHIQKDFESTFNYKKNYLEKFNIQVIEKTVTAPGLYHLGDVYVYPTTLDGLGLTMYEALSCGLPVITTDEAPMNEVINNNVGRLVDVEYHMTRSDAYYWPLAIVNNQSLINAMKYYSSDENDITNLKKKARVTAVKYWNWSDRKNAVSNAFEESVIIMEEPSRKFIKNKKIDEKIINKIGSSFIYSIYSKVRQIKLFNLFSKLR